MIVSERPREGWSVVNEQGETVALDLELTAELRACRPGPRGRPAGAGGAQDQRLRRQRPDQRSGGPPRARPPRRSSEHGATVADEVLAPAGPERAVRRGARRRRPETDDELGLTFTVEVVASA